MTEPTQHTHHYIPTRTSSGIILKCAEPGCTHTPGDRFIPPDVSDANPVNAELIHRVNTLPEEYRLEWFAHNEPPHGSVVIAHGQTGTAYQRHFSSGMWLGTSGKSVTWAQLLDVTDGNIVLLTWATTQKEGRHAQGWTSP